MTIEKKSKSITAITENSDLSTLSFSKFLSLVFQTRYYTLTKLRQQYNPSISWKKFQQEYNENTFLNNCISLGKVITNSIIYAFIPGWFFRAFFETLFSTSFWEFTMTKTEILIENHRLSVRTSISTRPLKSTTLLSLLPFLIGFFYFLTKKYPNYLNQSFFEKNIPGLSFPSEKLEWDTVHYLLKSKLKKENLQGANIKGVYQQNSLLLNRNIFENDLGQKIFINNYKNNGTDGTDSTDPIINQENFFLTSVSLDNSTTFSFFQNLDELPAYLESFSPQQSFTNSPELKIHELPFDFQKTSSSQKSIFEKANKNKNVRIDRQVSETVNKTFSIKPLNQISFKTKQINGPKNKFLETTFKKSKNFLGLKTSQKNQNVDSKKGIFLEKNPLSFEKNTLLTNKFFLSQKEFHDLWGVLQTELRNLFLNKNLIIALPKNGVLGTQVKSWDQETKSSNNSFLDIDSKIFNNLKRLSSFEEKSLLEEILSYLNEKDIIENSVPIRRMSGYRYPDMTTLEINRLFLHQKLTPLWFNFANISQLWSSPLSEFQKSFLQIKFPSSFLEATRYNLNIDSFPNFSVFTKPLILKDLQTQKVIYEGPGIFLDTDTGLDWKTEILKTNFQFKNFENNLKNQVTNTSLEDIFQPNKMNLRLWFQKYIVPYPGFTNPTKNFFTDVPKTQSFVETGFKNKFLGENSLSLQPLTNTEKYDWAKNFPLYPLQPQDQNNPDSLPRLTNLNESFFQLKTQLHVPFMAAEEWTKYYQKIIERKTQLKASDSQIKKFKQLDCFAIPILQTRVPLIQEKNSKLNQVTSQISLYDNIDYKVANTLLNLGPSNSFFLTSQTSLDNVLETETFGTVLSAGTYKKLPTSFSSFFGSNIFFQENWEPLTSQSWLIISQLGFAFSVFQILKTLADNYGRELLVYLLDLVAAVGVMDPQLKQEIEILMGQREKGFRIISNSRKKFSDIAGVKSLLPKVAEIVWFLRNSAREFSISKTLPRGILLIGPPGTGKTLLVQALAGEAHVPVLALSGSSLVEPGESGALKLEILFEEARRLAPCIVFLDEIDTLAQKREKVMQNPMATEGTDAILDVLTSSTPEVTDSPQFGKFRISLTSGQNEVEPAEASSDLSSTPSSLETQVTQQVQEQQDLQKEQLSLLMQFLIELDGVKTREGVIVIGATNRPEMLDAAVLRPGRFDRVLKLGLPGYEKRIEILKLYGQKLGYDESISWNYFAERTVGFAAADLASLMNQSSLRAILTETHHTVETIEHGIDRITTLESQHLPTRFSLNKKSTKIKDLLKTKNQFGIKKLVLSEKSIFEKDNKSDESKSSSTQKSLSKPKILESNRFAYYQAGKIICTSLLQHHPPILIAHLWPRRPNLRSLKIAQNLQNYFFKFARRTELEQRIIGCYSGKVGEILFLQKLAGFNSTLYSQKDISGITQLFNINLSTIGLEDLSFGQVLIKFLIENWHVYSTEALSYQMTELSDNRNRQELSEEKIALMDHLCQDLESTPRTNGQLLPSPFKSSERDQATGNDNRNFLTQHNFSIPWWQKHISSEFDVAERNFFDWYRIYMANPEETELNPDWSPPDEFYHRNKIHESLNSFSSKNKAPIEIPNLTFNQQRFIMDWWQTQLSTDCSWNDLITINQDYQIHSLVLQSFNKALMLIDKHRELLDMIASKLLTQKVLRQWDIVSIFENYDFAPFELELIREKNKQQTQFNTPIPLNFPKFTLSEKIVVRSQWGQSSRKTTANWIDFNSFIEVDK